MGDNEKLGVKCVKCKGCGSIDQWAILLYKDEIAIECQNTGCNAKGQKIIKFEEG